MTLEERCECAAETLPDHWRVRIDIEKGAIGVLAIRPDGSEVEIMDNEWDIEESVSMAISLARDEESAKAAQ